jgi:hypothetical protein
MSRFCTVNPALIGLALRAAEKQGFVPGSDPGMTGAADPAAGGGDPSAGGGDPAAAGGAAGGGGGGGGGGLDMSALQQMIQSTVQQSMQMGGGMGGGAAGAGKNALTPKIDEKAVMLQMLKILARIADHLQIPIPASEMVVNQNDMMGLAQASSTGGPMPGMDPSAGGGAQQGGGAAGGGSSIAPVQPMQGASPALAKQGSARQSGHAFDTRRLHNNSNLAAAIGMTLGRS